LGFKLQWFVGKFLERIRLGRLKRFVLEWLIKQWQ
jgi:hypothetical protein